jgi:HPt (histidine-containing phosphotransfer) domain-containing protein
MDGYVSKPIRVPLLAAELAAIVETPTLLGDESHAADFHKAGHGMMFDRATVLDNLGDEDLLHDLSAIFLAELPAELNLLRAAAQGLEPAALYAAAHTLKGSAANFGAEPLVAVLTAIEQDVADWGAGTSCPAGLLARIAQAEKFAQVLKAELEA